MKIHNFDKYWSIISITNSSGSALGTYEYDPYGILLSSSSNLGNFAFTGQEIDFETNLYHFPARYYEPHWGRFLTTDPYTHLPDDARNIALLSYIVRDAEYYAYVGEPRFPFAYMQFYDRIAQALSAQIFNRYVYVVSNPIGRIDPAGLQGDFPMISVDPDRTRMINPPRYCPGPEDICTLEFFTCLADELIGVKWTTITSLSGGAGDFLKGKAWQHAAKRILPYPLKSSIFRRFMFWGKALGPHITLSLVIYAEGKCIVEEFECLREHGLLQ